MKKAIFIDSKTININKAKKKCLKYKYVSFDVFDTLIKRNVDAPIRIFDILDNFAKEMGIDDFKNLRLNTESTLRQKQPFMTIEDIYVQISKKINKDVSEKLKETEIKIEKSYCQRNYDIYELYKFLRKNNKNIIAISDMYLPTNVINEILINAGYQIDKLYVSCDCKAKKRNGRLFQYVLENEKINSNEMIHFGDNYKVDILGSKMAKIESYHVSQKNNNFNVCKFKNKMIDFNNYKNYISVINNNLITQDNYYSKFGFALLGPLVYNYCIWLKEQCKKNNIKKIYFFARDGYTLKKEFDKLFPGEFVTKYIYFSRRAIRVPYYVINSSYDNIVKSFPKTKLIPMKVFFENLGLNPENYKKTLIKYNIKLSDNVFYNDLITKKIYKDIFDEIYSDIKTEAYKEFKIFKKYIVQEEFTGKIAIVDVGWHNSMQYYLEQLANNDKYEIDMYGLYVGRQSHEKIVKHTDSYIEDEVNSGYANSVASFIGLIESVFLADEGSTKRYVEKNNKVVPELFKYEYEGTKEYQAFNSIKNGIDNFINIVNSLPKFETFKLNGYDAYIPLKKYGTDPYLKDVGYFSKFKYLSEEIVYFANPKSITYYLFHRKEFMNDMYKSRWKVGFMKELFKIPFPYLRVYKYFHEKKER